MTENPSYSESALLEIADNQQELSARLFALSIEYEFRDYLGEIANHQRLLESA